jgi:hypothetical protein
VVQGLEGKTPWRTFEALELLNEFTQKELNNDSDSIETFLESKLPEIMQEYGDEAFTILGETTKLWKQFQKTEEPKRFQNLQNVWAKLGISHDLGKLGFHTETHIATQQLALITKFLDIKTVKQFNLSAWYRFTAGVVISKTGIALGASAGLFMEKFNDTLNTPAGLFSLCATTIFLSGLKAIQDARNLEGGAPALAGPETISTRRIFTKDYITASFWVHGLWLTPFLATAIAEHMNKDSNATLVGLISIFLGEMAYDQTLWQKYKQKFKNDI